MGYQSVLKIDSLSLYANILRSNSSVELNLTVQAKQTDRVNKEDVFFYPLDHLQVPLTLVRSGLISLHVGEDVSNQLSQHESIFDHSWNKLDGIFQYTGFIFFLQHFPYSFQLSFIFQFVSSGLLLAFMCKYAREEKCKGRISTEGILFSVQASLHMSPACQQVLFCVKVYLLVRLSEMSKCFC